MEKNIPLNSLGIVGAVFGTILLGLLLSEVAQPVGKQAGVATSPAPAAQPAPPPQPAPATQSPDLELKEREIKAEIERLKFDLEGYRRDLDVAERREREHQERFNRADLELKSRLLGEGVRLGSESLRAGNKVRNTEHRIRTKQQELQDLYKDTKR